MNNALKRKLMREHKYVSIFMSRPYLFLKQTLLDQFNLDEEKLVCVERVNMLLVLNFTIYSPSQVLPLLANNAPGKVLNVSRLLPLFGFAVGRHPKLLKVHSINKNRNCLVVNFNKDGVME